MISHLNNFDYKAITAAKERFAKVFAVDSIAERLGKCKNSQFWERFTDMFHLEQAVQHGATPLSLTSTSLKEDILSSTEGRGVDVVLEVVGTEAALNLATELVSLSSHLIGCPSHDYLFLGSSRRGHLLLWCSHPACYHPWFHPVQ
jgi:hypothetical protein